MAHSSSGLGHLPLKEETRGSNPLCATTEPRFMRGFQFIMSLLMEVSCGRHHVPPTLALRLRQYSVEGYACPGYVAGYHFSCHGNRGGPSDYAPQVSLGWR